MMMETYVSESLALRVEKLETLKGDIPVYKDMLDVNLFETAGIVRSSALEAIASFSSPEAYPVLIQAIENLTREECVNVKDARRRIADKLIEENSYKF
jgi:HEAT repeat protein